MTAAASPKRSRLSEMSCTPPTGDVAAADAAAKLSKSLEECSAHPKWSTPPTQSKSHRNPILVSRLRTRRGVSSHHEVT